MVSARPNNDHIKFATFIADISKPDATFPPTMKDKWLVSVREQFDIPKSILAKTFLLVKNYFSVFRYQKIEMPKYKL